MLNLRRQAMMGEGRNQADPRARNPNRNSNEIRDRERGRLGESAKTAIDPFNVADIADCVQRPRVDAEVESLARAWHTSVLREHQTGFRESCISLGFGQNRPMKVG
jgi:hypothetical protein